MVEAASRSSPTDIKLRGRGGGHDQRIDGSRVAPRVRLLSLSATGREHADAFALEDADFAHEVVDQRYRAVKRVALREAVADKAIPERLAEEAWALAEVADSPQRILIFCNSRDHALKAKKAVDTRGKKK